MNIMNSIWSPWKQTLQCRRWHIYQQRGRKRISIYFKVPQPEQGQVALEAAGEPWRRCSCLAWTRLRTAHTELPQRPAAITIIPSQCHSNISLVLCNNAISSSEDSNRNRSTLATPLGGYSPFSLGSTHCLTLSSLSLGVALNKQKTLILDL